MEAVETDMQRARVPGEGVATGTITARPLQPRPPPGPPISPTANKSASPSARANHSFSGAEPSHSKEDPSALSMTANPVSNHSDAAAASLIPDVPRDLALNFHQDTAPHFQAGSSSGPPGGNLDDDGEGKP